MPSVSEYSTFIPIGIEELVKEYQKPLKRKGLALFPKEKGKTARIRREASEENEPFFGEFSLERKIEFQRFCG